MSRWRQSLLCLLPMLLIPTCALSAQPNVFQLVSGVSDDPQLQSIISRTAALELERAGLSSEQAGSAGAADLSSALARAAQTKAPYLLLIQYRSNNGQLNLRMTFARVTDRTTIDEKQEQLPVDLELDTRLSSTLSSLLAGTDVRNEMATAKRAGALTEATSSNTVPEAPASSETPPAADTGQRPADGGTLQPSAVGSTGAQSVERTAARRGAFAITLGTAPLILVGTASDYFRYGVVVGAGFLLPISPFGLTAAIGLKVDALRVFPVSDLPQGAVYAFSFGPALEISTNPAAPAVLSVRATGGAAVLTLQLPGASLQAKTIPSMDIGAAGLLRLSPHFSLGAELNYLAVFESSNPVMGLVPGLLLRIEL